jgi:hypothetical protein
VSGEPRGSVVAVNAGPQHPQHVADPSALEDPVHRDVAAHELHEEGDQAGAGNGDERAGDRTGAGDEPADAAVPPTGDDRVDAAVERLAELNRRPPAEHVPVYDDVHRRLQDTLADLDGS